MPPVFRRLDAGAHRVNMRRVVIFKAERDYSHTTPSFTRSMNKNN